MTYRIARSVILLTGLLPLPGLAWGPAGHEAIGATAALWLSNQGYASTLDHVRATLRPGETLAGVSNWADRIKSGSALPGDPDSEAFLADSRNLEPTVENGKPRHFSFHYTDRPFQAQAYEPTGIGARPDDIVGVINACVDALRRPESPDARFSPRVALALLAHFIGDLHQPLHVGSGYIGSAPGGDWRFVYPSSTNSAICDEGGNKESFSLDGRVISLHRFWDENAALAAMANRSPDRSAALLATGRPRPEWKAAGPVRNWARVWASDTLKASRELYAPVRIKTSSGRREQTEWTIAFEGGDGAYTRMAADLARRQMAKAGYRLAEILHAIWP